VPLPGSRGGKLGRGCGGREDRGVFDFESATPSFAQDDRMEEVKPFPVLDRIAEASIVPGSGLSFIDQLGDGLSLELSSGYHSSFCQRTRFHGRR
jgi:hypothetical protein